VKSGIFVAENPNGISSLLCAQIRFTLIFSAATLHSIHPAFLHEILAHNYFFRFGHGDRDQGAIFQLRCRAGSAGNPIAAHQDYDGDVAGRE
jgi:hypothetical protein